MHFINRLRKRRAGSDKRHVKRLVEDLILVFLAVSMSATLP